MEDPIGWERGEKLWGKSIYEWQCGNHGMVIDLVNALDIPMNAKEFLSALVKGDTKLLRQGRPPARTGQEERAIMWDAFREWDKLKESGCKDPRNTAFANVAEKYSITEDAVRGIMDEVRPFGLTLSFWKKFGKGIK